MESTISYVNNLLMAWIQVIVLLLDWIRKLHFIKKILSIQDKIYRCLETIIECGKCKIPCSTNKKHIIYF